MTKQKEKEIHIRMKAMMSGNKNPIYDRAEEITSKGREAFIDLRKRKKRSAISFLKKGKRRKLN